MSLLNSDKYSYQRNLTHTEGVKTATATHIRWTSRFITMSGGADAEHLADGYVSINFPANGTVIETIKTVNLPAGSSVTVVADGIPLGAWQTLWYRHTPGAGQASSPGNFFISPLYTHHYHTDDSMIMIATRTGTGYIKWGDGITTSNRGETSTGDFWRRAGSGLLGLPLAQSAQTDETDGVVKRGKVGIGQLNQAPIWEAVAQLDVASVARSGVDQRSASSPLYVTGNIDSVGLNTATDPSNLCAGVLHSNQTQGVGIFYDGLAKIGSAANLPFHFKAKGTGEFTFTYPTGDATFDHYSPKAETTATALYYQERWWRGNVVQGQMMLQRTAGITARSNEIRWYHRTNGTYAIGMRLEPDQNELGTTTLSVGENNANRKKVVYWNGSSNNAFQFMGIGVDSTRGSSIAHHTYADWRTNWFHSPNATSHDLMMTLQNVGSEGRLGINNRDTPMANLDVGGNAVIGTVHPTRSAGIRPGILNAHANTLTPAADIADESVAVFNRPGISSVSWATGAEIRIGKTTAGINSTTRMSWWINQGGTNLPNTEILRMSVLRPLWTRQLPVYANDAQAAAGGLIPGDYYKAANGTVSQR